MVRASDSANPVAVLRTVLDEGKQFRSLWMWCPGCELAHRVEMVGESGDVPPVAWEWDGNLDAPTISPSILTWGTHKGDGSERRCHSFVRAGQWEFLSDSTHALAGQTVPLPPVPDWMVRR